MKKAIKHQAGVSVSDLLLTYLRAADAAHAPIRRQRIEALLGEPDAERAAVGLQKILLHAGNEGFSVDHAAVDYLLQIWDAETRAALLAQLAPRKRAPGGGRKPLGESPKVAFPVSRVAPDVAGIVRKHDNMTEFVEEAIRAHHKLD